MRLYSCESIFIIFAPCYVNFRATSLDSGGKFNFLWENTEMVDKVCEVDASLCDQCCWMWLETFLATFQNIWDLENCLWRTLSFLYFTITIANYNCCEMRMTHQENKHGRFACVLHVATVYILPSLQKSHVNMVPFTVFGKQNFCSFSGWPRRWNYLKLSGLTVLKDRASRFPRLFHRCRNLYVKISGVP